VCVHENPIGIWSVRFCGGRKTGEPGEKPSEQEREPTTNSTHIWHRAGIEPGPYWWEASALTTAPPLLPIRVIVGQQSICPGPGCIECQQALQWMNNS